MIQSGNYDSPPASDSPHETADLIVREILDNNQVSEADISPSGELYRVIERFHRRAILNRTNLRHPILHAMASDDDQERTERLQREAARDASPLYVLPPFQPSGPPEPMPRDRAALRLAGMTARRGRLRSSASERYLERQRALSGESGADNENYSGPRGESRSGLAGLQRAGRQLEAASSNLRALLDDPVPNLSSPTLEAEYSSEEAEHNRRAKRRKVDDDRVDSSFAGFSYGKYGQVEPGKLKMEIVSCDGGIFQGHGGNYSAENILKNDATVYCTKSNRCNLVLRHQGATVFSLKELIIKAPHSGYTAP
jgi:hypothetical protein